VNARRSIRSPYPTGPAIATKPYIHQKYIRRRLNEEPETILKLLNIELNERLTNDSTLRVGNKGSLNISREKTHKVNKGIWFNFETEESGDMFDLAKATLKLSDRDMIDYALKHIFPILKDVNSDSESSLLEGALPKQVSHNKKTERHLNKILDELEPLEGSIAEEYLKIHRKIMRVNTENLKFHPKLGAVSKLGGYLSQLPALVSIASHPESDEENIQVTYLNPRTKNKHKDVVVAKQTFGSFASPDGYHFCEIYENDIEQGVTFVCEGVETALSVHQAFPEDHLIATLGKYNFGKLDPDILNQKVVLIFDNDGKDIEEDVVFKKTSKKLVEAGKDVYIVVPPLVGELEKTDMNDVLIHLGEEGVYNVVTKNMKKVD